LAVVGGGGWGTRISTATPALVIGGGTAWGARLAAVTFAWSICGSISRRACRRAAIHFCQLIVQGSKS